MLTVAYIRHKREEAIQRFSIRNVDVRETFENVISLDDKRKETQIQSDKTLAELNAISKKIGELFKTGLKDEATRLKNDTHILKETSNRLGEELSAIEQSINAILIQIPNAPDISVPKGKNAEDNKLVREEGKIPELGPAAKPHWEIAASYDIIDFELGSKITGSGFPVFKGKGARLQRALINFFLDKAVEAGYTEIQPPVMINEASGYGTGQLPDKDNQMYKVSSDNFYLVPTAEVPLTNIYRDVILKPEDMPVKITAYTPCFRREAGSYGKDVKGLNRLHQFDKVEIVQIRYPDESYMVLEEMTEYVACLLRLLELPFRIVKLCGGDMGFTSSMTYDMEVFSAGQKKWLEVSSISNFESFQANRLKLRFKDGNKTNLLHTLNGSALALPRIVAALLENNQTPEGIKIPDSLTEYTGFDLIK